MLAAFGALLPRVPRALLVNRTYYARLSLELAPLFGCAVHIERTLTRGAEVARLAARGLVVNVWTVNDPTEAADPARLGVDGIITDVPEVVRAALA